MFRNKKKVKDEVSQPRPSTDSTSSAMPSFKSFRKPKKVQEPEKVELNVSTALPSNDDFRTSLLMSGLSARFSMLREQDDPLSKIGKASDDSVLSPNRQSRLDFSASRNLGDIAEIESIRQPSAPFTRMDSYISSDDADSTHGSIMSRAKPTEGNNLFGGRQKIYKIPAGADSSQRMGQGMGGRALYEDDVALSAFQRWRREERERRSFEEDRKDDETSQSGELDTDSLRPDSHFSGYNRKRDTSSTEASSLAARNSTAATSIASNQPSASLKDWQPSAGPNAAVERNVTRTRRLYESSLNHELQEQQSFATSRFDSLSRRGLGNRTPDSLVSPSPTSSAFTSQLAGERKILSKASAPNLRSASPHTMASPAVTENQSPSLNFGGSPPLSPPISESEETSILSIRPDDRGKATALGLFQKPNQSYDDSRYAQRQMQLQQGRDTPTQRLRPETASKGQPRPNSLARQRQFYESKSAESLASQRQAAAKEPTSTFLAEDSETSPSASPVPAPVAPLATTAYRPLDMEHPAFRPSTVAESPAGEDDSANATETNDSNSPADSPTLGPTEGLSGMVRQHLRGDSDASSIYGAAPPTAGLESRFPRDPDDSKDLEDMARNSNPWDAPVDHHDWDVDYEDEMPTTDAAAQNIAETQPTEEEQRRARATRRSGDEFASQLADGARRVRERLTTYVETDSRSTSPHAPTDRESSLDLQPPPRLNGLGILRSKSSGSSLSGDRGRDESQSKAMKMLGLSSRGNSPAPAKSPIEPAFRAGGSRDGEPRSASGDHSEPARKSSDEGSHAGIRAFRQARREMQRMKEAETQAARRKPAPSPAPMSQESHSTRTTPPREAMFRQRTPSRDPMPPRMPYQQRIPSEESRYYNTSLPASRSASRAGRDRSGSESSNPGRSRSRPPPLRQNSDFTKRSPGPGIVESRTSPAVAPYGYMSGSPARMDSPGSRPGSRPPPAIPAGFDGPPSSPQDAMRRRVGGREISEPTFVSSTSRVPTRELSLDAMDPRSNGIASAPPVPPINPRRRQDSSLSREGVSASSSTPNLLRGRESQASMSATDTDEPQPRRMRKLTPPELSGFNAKLRSNNTPVIVGPPASRMVVTSSTQNQKPSKGGVPGGMI